MGLFTCHTGDLYIYIYIYIEERNKRLLSLNFVPTEVFFNVIFQLSYKSNTKHGGKIKKILLKLSVQAKYCIPDCIWRKKRKVSIGDKT